MKSSIFFLIVAFVVIGCAESTSPKNGADKKVSNSTKNNKSANPEEQPANISYKTLRNLLENAAPITNEYLRDSIPVYGKALNEHEILNETDHYIFVEGSGGETSLLNYYLISFSKDTGKLIDYLGLGQEAEGVSPNEVRWESDHSFSTVNYQYELLEDEESGAYVQGALLDSTVLTYKVSAKGFISPIE